jgi:hypothetical protein
MREVIQCASLLRNILSLLSDTPVLSSVRVTILLLEELIKPKFFGYTDPLAAAKVVLSDSSLPTLIGSLPEINGGTVMMDTAIQLLMTTDPSFQRLVPSLISSIDTHCPWNSKEELLSLLVEECLSRLPNTPLPIGKENVMKTFYSSDEESNISSDSVVPRLETLGKNVEFPQRALATASGASAMGKLSAQEENTPGLDKWMNDLKSMINELNMFNE